MANTIDMEFADGAYTFALPGPQMDELQAKCGNIGIGEIFGRVLAGCRQIGNEVVIVPTESRYFRVDLVETIRQGLLGGGKGVVNEQEIVVTPVLAERLIQNYVVSRPLVQSHSLAAAILGACIVGYDPPKKDEPAPKRATKKKAGSTTPSS